MISDFKIHDCGTNRPEFSPLTSWLEVRVDGEKVAAFGTPEGVSYAKVYDKAHNLVKDTCLDLYREKVMEIVEVRKVQTKDKKGHWSRTLDGLKEKVVFETHPTVAEFEIED